MAISKGSAKLLMLEHRDQAFSGSLLQLGQQAICWNLSEMLAWAQRIGLDLNGISLPQRTMGRIDNRRFFSSLGFSEVLSCDISAYECADLILDLNLWTAPHLHSRFDVILDAGTLEHIFHVPNVLANLHRMLKVGGRIIHFSPASTQVDHGFYSFSPTFFYDYYTSNGYLLRRCYMFECLEWTSTWKVYAYAPGSLDFPSNRIGTNRIMGMFVVAQKTANSTEGVIPEQSFYQRTRRHLPPPPRFGTTREFLKKHLPRAADAFFWVKSIKYQVQRRWFMPPLVGKF